jgi:hypothetical protein
MSEPTTVSDAPITTTGERTRQFESSVTELVALLGLDDDVAKALGRRFSVVTSDEGIGFHPGSADAVAPLFLAWSAVGPLRSESISGEPFDVEIAAETAVCLLSGHGIGGGAMEHPVLCIPVTVDDTTVELRVTVKCEWDIAERLEARRPV